MHTWGRHVLYFGSAESCSKMVVLVSHDVLHKFTGVLDYTSLKKRPNMAPENRPLQKEAIFDKSQHRNAQETKLERVLPISSRRL